MRRLPIKPYIYFDKIRNVSILGKYGLFFPQMRPETKAKIVLSEIEKMILEIAGQQNIPLSDLRDKISCSNNQWDASLKNLVKQNVLKIVKEEGNVFVSRI